MQQLLPLGLGLAALVVSIVAMQRTVRRDSERRRGARHDRLFLVGVLAVFAALAAITTHADVSRDHRPRPSEPRPPDSTRSLPPP